MTTMAVEVKDLTKRYGNVTAVNQVSFTLEEGKIYGLLGRNGAGKTTIMHMLTAQLFATSGDIRIFGEEPYENHQVLSRVCFIKESQKYPEHYKIEQVLKFAASLYPNWDQAFAEKLMQSFNLPKKRMMKKLSRGMLSSVGVVIGLASRAPLTIFDEPYLGLDAVARSLFYDELMQDYAEFPRTIVLSTHLIDEVSRLLEHILLIDKGSIILNEEADILRERAYSIAGQRTLVEQFAANKRVIHSEPFGGLLSMTILGKLNETERSQAGALGLEIAPVSLQQLVIHLTRSQQPAEGVVLQ